MNPNPESGILNYGPQSTVLAHDDDVVIVGYLVRRLRALVLLPPLTRGASTSTLLFDLFLLLSTHRRQDQPTNSLSIARADCG